MKKYSFLKTIIVTIGVLCGMFAVEAMVMKCDSIKCDLKTGICVGKNCTFD
jgi:hypothetical protein